MARRADVGTEVVASADLQTEAAEESEMSKAVEDVFEPLLSPSPAEEEAVRRKAVERQRYAEALLSRDKGRLASLLREKDLPLYVRREIADILDRDKRWYPKWRRYEALEVAVYAEDPKQTLEAQGYPYQIVKSVVAEVEALRLAYAHLRLRMDEELSYEEATARLAELHKRHERTIEGQVAEGRSSIFYNPGPLGADPPP
jgi:hypothetical protein